MTKRVDWVWPSDMTKLLADTWKGPAMTIPAPMPVPEMTLAALQRAVAELRMPSYIGQWKGNKFMLEECMGQPKEKKMGNDEDVQSSSGLLILEQSLYETTQRLNSVEHEMQSFKNEMKVLSIKAEGLLKRKAELEESVAILRREEARLTEKRRVECKL